MIQFFRRYRELFAIVALLCLPLVTYLAYAKRGRPLNAFDRAVIWVSSPLERLVTRVGFGIIDTWKGYVALRHVRDENLELRKQVLRLKDEVARGEETRAENDRLRKDLDYVEVSGTRAVVSPVIGWSPTTDYLSCLIGKGSRDGVEHGMAVASPDGVVGRVEKVYPGAATVILIGDSKLAIPVQIQRSRARATVRGRGQRTPTKLVLANALRTDDIEDGDVAVTQGVELFPKGLVVGKVRNVVTGKHGMFKDAEVIPAADVSRLEEVLVLVAPPAEQSEARSIAP